MSDEDKSSKTEEPTEKKREEAFKQGNFAKSQDIGVVFVLAASLMVLIFFGKEAATRVSKMAVDIFSHLDPTPITDEGAADLFKTYFTESFLVSLPMLAGCLGAALISGALQSGLKLTPKVLEPNFNKLNPVKGFQNLFSLKSLLRSVGDLAKFIVIAAIVFWACEKIAHHDIFSAPVAVPYIGIFIYDTFITMMLWLVFAMGIIAAISYIYQRYKTTQDLRMTKQEIKDEHKSQEVDPLIKSAQRSMARRLLQKQMIEEVPYADVVVTNPTHYAIALKYESGKDSAPKVVAKGYNMFARRIKDIAAQHGVPMVENKPAARLMYKIARVDEPIPSNLYHVVAEILMEVYKTHKQYFKQLPKRRKVRDKERADAEAAAA